MPLTLIEGHYEIVGAAPDGDSVKFYPQNPDDWKLVGGSHPVRVNKRGGAQLRLDAIDALETHYNPPGGLIGSSHQPLDLAHAAADFALSWLGFKNVERNDREVVTAAEPVRVEGYILTRFSDVYGRCVAFAFRGRHRGKSGDSIHFDEATLARSINHALIDEGLAYPTYYSKLYVDMRRALTKTAQKARASSKGIWAKDRTTQGFRVGTLEQVESEGYIMPKLYRRLMDYFELNEDDTALDQFKAYLDTRDDRVVVLSEGQITNFATVVKTEDQSVKLTTSVDDLVFLEA